ncbi:4760_t:CDS:2 [Entrophospora sp. SA101]|nr:12220_t:CDS:2 [Entrophospora sp. SA101]CAJ0834963.1 4760_t:CDS:2 [Entrophospora sp. SA101]
MNSKYPKFHKYVTKGYLLLIGCLGVILPICYEINEQPNLTEILIIIAYVILSYVIYWLIVRLNCYGIPIQKRNNLGGSIYSQHGQNNSSSTLSNNNNTIIYQTFANYRLNGLVERIRIFGRWKVLELQLVLVVIEQEASPSSSLQN